MAESPAWSTTVDRLIDRYNSGELSRRDFLRTASAIIGGVAAAGGLSGAFAQGATPEAAATPAVAIIPAAKTGGKFTYALNQAGDTLDPAITTYAMTNKININVFDPLIWQAPDLSYVPGLASSYEVAPDGMSFTFHLRQDVKFHDGTPLNAAAVKFSWDRIMLPETQSKTAIGQMGPFKQAVVVDEFTVRAEFGKPFAPFLDAVSQSYCAPVSPAAVAKFGTDFAHNLVGTGPFKLKEWVENDHVTLVKNPDYNWAPSIFGHQGAAYLDEIVFPIIIDDSVRTGTLQSGESDGIDSVAAKDVSLFSGDTTTYRVLNSAVPGIPNLFTLNTQKAPTDDLAVRQALNFATDKATIISTLFFNQYVPAYGPMSAATLGFDPTLKDLFPFDVAKANAALDAAGWVMGAGGIRAKAGQPLKISLYTAPTDLTPPLLQSQWKAVGIDTEINQMDYNALIPIMTKGDGNLGNIGWIQADPDVASIILSSKNIGTAFNWSRYTSPDLDKALTDAASTVDQAKRTELYGKVQQLAMAAALVVPINDLAAIYALHSYVKNFRIDTRGWYPWLYDVWMDK